MAAFIHFSCMFHGRGLDGSLLKYSPHSQGNLIRTSSNIFPSKQNNLPTRTTVTCRSYKQPPKKPGSKNWLKEHKLYRKPIPLSKLGVGERRLGTVRNLVPWGAYVDVGAEKDGLVHLRDMSEEYVAHPSYIVTPGDCVEVFVKFVDVNRKILALSLIPVVEDFEGKFRVGITALKVGQKILAVVKRVTNYGTYVDIGCTRDAWIHVGSLWGERPRSTLNELKIGEKVWVFVESIDGEKSFISCRARTQFGCKKLTEEDGDEKEEHESVLKDHPRYGKHGRKKDMKKLPMIGDIEKPMRPDEMFGSVIDKSDVEAMEKAKAEEPPPQVRQHLIDEIPDFVPGSKDTKKAKRKMLFAGNDDESDDESDGDLDEDGESIMTDYRDSKGRYIVDPEFVEEMERASTERYQVMDKKRYNFLAGKRSHLRPPPEVIDPF